MAVNILGDRCFDVVGLLSGDRLCDGSMDVLGDRFEIELRGDLLRGGSIDDLGDRFLIESRDDRCLMLLVC